MKVMTRTFALMTAIFFALLIAGVVYAEESSSVNINTAGETLKGKDQNSLCPII